MFADMNDHSDTDDAGDGEGVWSPDIEQCFREALLLFPPCGRRKHILQEEGGGKMYGRNEFIARHIRMRTGKIRTRKQVSSHIQVLARRKAKAEAVATGTGLVDSESPTSSINGTISSMRMQSRPNSTSSNNQQNEQQSPYYDVWADRPIVTQKIRLVEYSAFIEYRRSHLPATQPLNESASSSLSNLANAASVLSLNNHGLNETMIKNENQTSLSSQIDELSLTGAASTPTTPLYQSQPSMFLATTTANNVQQQPLISSQQHHLQLNQRNQQEVDSSNILQGGASQNNSTSIGSINPNHLQAQNLPQQHQSNSGFTRHPYFKIDYRHSSDRQTNKLERIVLSQIQDKFPKIGGPDGLFQRGPADAFFLIKIWADLNCAHEYNVDDQNSYFGFSCHFETVEPLKDITCSTKVCSHGKYVVEKVEKIYCKSNSTNGRYSYEINRSPMCEFIIKFIKQLLRLPKVYQMNRVLENFTVLQEITSESTSEVLLCLAYVFEVANPENNYGSQYRVYKLTKD